LARIAGIVDQDVNGAVPILDGADRCGDRIAVGDVELHHVDVEPLGLGSILQRGGLREVSHRRMGRVAASGERQRRIQSDTRAAPRNQNNCHEVPFATHRFRGWGQATARLSVG